MKINNVKKMFGAKNKDFLTCRRILSIMVISHFMVQYMLRVNMPIAIVDMISTNNSNVTPQINRFSWNEEEKNEILGSFFWGYVPLTAIGGRLTEVYGSRITMGTSMVLASVLTLITPIVSSASYYWLLTVRVALGASMGVLWPSLPPMVSQWIPTKNKSKFMSHSAASSLGIVIAFPLCGYSIAHFGWPSAFYVTGAIAAIPTIAWFFFVYDSPRKHPRISTEEKERLESEISPEDSLEKRSAPWRKILTSKPVWAMIVANTSFLFNLHLVVNQLPTYMNDVLHYSIEENGLFSSVPHIAHYIISVISSCLADKWTNNGTFSLGTIRTIFTGATLCVPGVLFAVQCFWGYNPLVSNIVFTLSVGFLGCNSAGIYSNCLDISPCYSGTIYGLANACGALAGYVSTKMVAQITKDMQSFEQWRYIFGIQVVTCLVGFILYMVLASGELQSWNNAKCDEEEPKSSQ